MGISDRSAEGGRTPPPHPIFVSKGRGLGVKVVSVVVLGSFRRRFEPLDHVP